MLVRLCVLESRKCARIHTIAFTHLSTNVHTFAKIAQGSTTVPGRYLLLDSRNALTKGAAFELLCPTLT